MVPGPKATHTWFPAFRRISFLPRETLASKRGSLKVAYVKVGQTVLRVRAPQTRGSPPMRREKADGGGRDARPPSAQKIAQLVPSDLVVSHRVESQLVLFIPV